MARGITDPASLPPSATPLTGILAEYGYANVRGDEPGWRFFENHRLASVSKRIQVRDTAHLAPSGEVAKYAADLKRGDVFPPVILTSDGYIVDGSTRTEAARKAGLSTFPTFVLTVTYENAPKAVRDQIEAIGVRLNNRHGKRMTREENARMVERVVAGDAGASPRDIAATLGISDSQATAVMLAARAKSRAQRLGIKPDDTLTTSHLKVLGQRGKHLNDPVFAELVRLTQDARVKLHPLVELFQRLEKTGTDEERLAILKAEREAARVVIKRGFARPSPSARLRQTLGHLLNTETENLVEPEPGAQAEHRAVLREASRKLMAVMEAQDRADIARAVRE